MEKMLQRIASQLAAYDEASLLSLWDKYRREVETFQPTRQWEESVLILCLLQSVRWKNQLFNSKWMEQRTADSPPGEVVERQEDQPADEPGSGDGGEERDGPRGRVLSFPSPENES